MIIRVKESHKWFVKRTQLFICSSSQARLYHPTDPRRRQEVLGFGQAGTGVAVLAVDGSAKGSEGTAMVVHTTAAPIELVVELLRGLLRYEGVSLHEGKTRCGDSAALRRW